MKHCTRPCKNLITSVIINNFYINQHAISQVPYSEISLTRFPGVFNSHGSSCCCCRSSSRGAIVVVIGAVGRKCRSGRSHHFEAASSSSPVERPSVPESAGVDPNFASPVAPDAHPQVSSSVHQRRRRRGGARFGDHPDVRLARRVDAVTPRLAPIANRRFPE